ncbi:hypothetical protein CGCF415_v008563 [Colletotrichum fructicola]|uniref:Uncharacterized protein n=2 Tax=Colletotrichum gloeosporioides species complex TaxID=2707338 RepID=L2GAZ2_COLFN|nr:uncharacterized protein CGMCC3_g11462 [Colletotrichum fructicola]XP_053039216.1 uncharacterized protein COL26b_004009 [Colletotrichum chrysophilum]KAF4484956.1 hypothetical protein CGGC5_v007932 [Colletotrichum fructicola Nara gc5]KAI8273266.1 hypothetical protein K4K60_011102 [Colletotrichum sp. SAR11_57]KAE9572503.1 hypothetical protein CGMCC3_g11462 [Colletotrichum fructicola]KAF4893484.1 hypothetical protein CGCFRS4_v007024 [Colletotrichum fructicola]KAF4904601.1 hypothetical protein C
MPTSQVSGASHGSSNKKSKTARAKESKSRVDDYLAEEGSLYERIPNDSKAKDRTKAYKDRARETTRDADRRLGSR